MDAEEAKQLICSELWGGNRAEARRVILPGLEGAVYAQPCGGGVGGDVHYLSACGSGATARICLADVAGHGEDVARVGEWLHGLMRRHMHFPDPGRTLVALNRRATEHGLSALTTAACLSYDLRHGRLRYCYAGHPPALVFTRRAGVWRTVGVPDDGERTPRNLPLAVEADTAYDVHIAQLEPGDRLVLYSDGVTEAPAADRRLFGVNGLLAVLAGHDQDAPLTLVKAVVEALAQHAGTKAFVHDDVTIMAFDVQPYENKSKLWLITRNHWRKWRARRR